MVKFAIAALLVAAATATSAHGSDVQLLDFSSPYCGPCQSMVPVIQSLEARRLPDPARRHDPRAGVAQQYQVTQIPCFIMLVEGRETERIVGATGQDQLVEMFQRRDAAADAVAGRTVATGSIAPQAVTQPAATQAVNDPWSGVGAASAATPNPGGGDAPAREARPMTHTAPIGPREPLQDAFANELIGSSVRLRVDDATGHSYGTGTIIDSRSGEALVITCGHLFRDSKGKGPVMVELFSGDAGRRARRRAGAGPDHRLQPRPRHRPGEHSAERAGARRADRADANDHRARRAAHERRLRPRRESDGARHARDQCRPLPGTAEHRSQRRPDRGPQRRRACSTRPASWWASALPPTTKATKDSTRRSNRSTTSWIDSI